MATIDFSKIPHFTDLPVKPGAPPESSWGVFGDDDQVGCLNFLTSDGVVEAARLVSSGAVFRLDAPINYSKPTLFGRPAAKHTINSWEHIGLLGFDDLLDSYNTQEGSQWDGLAHVGLRGRRAFYNGVTPEQIKSGPEGKLGIHLWANRVVGKGLLLDAFAYRASVGRPISPLEPERYTLDDLKGAAKAQKVVLRPGTVLLVRTGWMQAYLNAPQQEKDHMGTMEGIRACGIDDSREIIEWLWDNRVAALGTDCPAVEPWPWDILGNDDALHFRALARLGLPIGEQFNLESLAGDCARDGRYEFLVVSVPLNLEGGIASPPNAVAIK